MIVAPSVKTYDVSLMWNVENNLGVLESENKRALPFSAPAEHGGSDALWSPEHLLCASVSACYTTTFLHFAKLLKVAIADFQISATVEFEKQDKVFEATRFILHPIIKFESHPGQQMVDNLIAKAKKYCFVGNSVKGEVVVDATVNQ